MPPNDPAPIPVSVIILTREEEAALPGCLASVAGFAEVHVVDSHSRDGTAACAHAAGAQVTGFSWNGRYPKKKQWALDHLPLAHDWVLLLDADERVTPELAREIGALMAQGPEAAAYFVTFRVGLAGRLLRFGRAHRKIVLLDRRRTAFPEIDDLDAPGGWEVEGHYQPFVQGNVGQLRSRAEHHELKGPGPWDARHRRYAAWEAHLLARDGGRALQAAERGGRRLLKWLFHRLPLREAIAFLDSYVLRLGFLDGAAGWSWAMARGRHYARTARLTRAVRRAAACRARAHARARPRQAPALPGSAHH